MRMHRIATPRQHLKKLWRGEESPGTSPAKVGLAVAANGRPPILFAEGKYKIERPEGGASRGYPSTSLEGTQFHGYTSRR